MLKTRLIPVVLMRNGVCVQSKGFRRYQRLGDPITIVERLSAWASDELCYLDISQQSGYDVGRDDLCGSNHDNVLAILQDISRRCFMPLAFGGGIRTLQDVEKRLALGADKVVINTQALNEPSLIDEAARQFGSQCITICIDARQALAAEAAPAEGPQWFAFSDGGRCAAGRNAVAWAREAADRGAGEILIQSIDQDGRGLGYDLKLIRAVVDAVRIPVIALGGVGSWEHLAEGVAAGAAAVAAANIFNYTENSVYNAKLGLVGKRLNFRAPRLAPHFI